MIRSAGGPGEKGLKKMGGPKVAHFLVCVAIDNNQ